MPPRGEESDFVFCDLQAAARFIRRDNPEAASSFLEAVYDSFEFLARNPGAGRARADLGFPSTCSDCSLAPRTDTYAIAALRVGTRSLLQPPLDALGPVATLAA